MLRSEVRGGGRASRREGLRFLLVVGEESLEAPLAVPVILSPPLLAATALRSTTPGEVEVGDRAPLLSRFLLRPRKNMTALNKKEKFPRSFVHVDGSPMK